MHIPQLIRTLIAINYPVLLMIQLDLLNMSIDYSPSTAKLQLHVLNALDLARGRRS